MNLKTKIMMRLTVALFTLCSLVSLKAAAAVTFHSPDKAAELTSEILDKLLYEADSKGIYELSSETLKSNVY